MNLGNEFIDQLGTAIVKAVGVPAEAVISAPPPPPAPTRRPTADSNTKKADVLAYLASLSPDEAQKSGQYHADQLKSAGIDVTPQYVNKLKRELT